MLLLVLLQFAIFFVIMIIGGEFRYVREYAYSVLEEKTENRRNYVETELQNKIPFLQDGADSINKLVAEILEENHSTIDAIKTDGNLDRSIIANSVDILVDIMRRGMVNDAFIILDTGDLYKESGNDETRVALYLRDLDTKTEAGYEDLLMELGFTSISKDLGFTLDSGWSLYFTPDPNDTENFDFYYRTIKTAEENRSVGRDDLGYWSGFSRISRGSAASMKYTMPLIAEDGTIYGVIGIGLTENTLMANFPSNDFLNESACYVPGYDHSDNNFNIVTHSGSSFSRLVGTTKILPVAGILQNNICDFDLSTGVDLAGNVQYMDLYNSSSPYYHEQWALISVADRSSVLRLFTLLVQILIIASVVTLVVGTVVAILCCYGVVKPISNAIHTMRANRKYSQVIRFQPSNIFEIDEMTDAITQLQINVNQFSSQVSKMMRIANVGIGTFMHDRTDDSVFVGQSLLVLLNLEERKEEDMVMSRKEFLERIRIEDLRIAITEGLETAGDEEHEDHAGIYSFIGRDGNTRWIRLGFTYSQNMCIGIIQDITNTMMERKRIEYERDYDGLTGLLNRQAYQQRIEELFRAESRLKIAAYIMIDLDNLKYVNDTYGHDFGDNYIKTAAIVLRQFQNYGGIVSRISGDEFNICLPGFSSKQEARDIINQVRDELLQSSCLLADGTRFKVRASMGVSWYPDDSVSYEMLKKYADLHERFRSPHRRGRDEPHYRRMPCAVCIPGYHLRKDGRDLRLRGADARGFKSIPVASGTVENREKRRQTL